MGYWSINIHLFLSICSFLQHLYVLTCSVFCDCLLLGEDCDVFCVLSFLRVGFRFCLHEMGQHATDFDDFHIFDLGFIDLCGLGVYLVELENSIYFW